MRFDYHKKFNQNNLENKTEEIKEPIVTDILVQKEPAEDFLKENEEIKELHDFLESNLLTKDVISAPITEEKQSKKGKVTKCELLNARVKPELNSEVACVLNKDEVVLILDNINDFYKIEKDNKELYCMKKYIEIIEE